MTVKPGFLFSLRNAVAGLLLLLPVPGMAQQAAAPGGFEVSTVKPTPPVNDGHTHINYPHGGDFSAQNITLLTLMSWAFDMPEKRILNAPDWMTAQRFDVQAKTDATADVKLRALDGDEEHAEKRRMVQELLRDRFGLKLHAETQVLSALDLVTDGAPKLTASKASGRTLRGGRNTLSDQGVTTDMIAEQFSRITGRVVVDRTGLTGHYDLKLEWTPEDSTDPASSAPDFFRAIQEQLGLKLVPANESLPVLVIDAVSQPTAN